LPTVVGVITEGVEMGGGVGFPWIVPTVGEVRGVRVGMGVTILPGRKALELILVASRETAVTIGRKMAMRMITMMDFLCFAESRW